MLFWFFFLVRLLCVCLKQRPKFEFRLCNPVLPVLVSVQPGSVPTWFRVMLVALQYEEDMFYDGVEW